MLIYATNKFKHSKNVHNHISPKKLSCPPPPNFVLRTGLRSLLTSSRVVTWVANRFFVVTFSRCHTINYSKQSFACKLACTYLFYPVLILVLNPAWRVVASMLILSLQTMRAKRTGELPPTPTISVVPSNQEVSEELVLVFPATWTVLRLFIAETCMRFSCPRRNFTRTRRHWRRFCIQSHVQCLTSSASSQRRRPLTASNVRVCCGDSPDRALSASNAE